MKRWITVILVLALISLPARSWGQMNFGFTMPADVDRVEIPFIEANNLIVIPVVINNILKINFIVDTGVETPILTEMAFAKILGVDLIREVIVAGPGLQDSIRAYVGQKVNFRLPGNVIGHNLNLLVLQDDHLKLSEKMGIDVHGILGYDLFKSFVVEIDYDNKILVLNRPTAYRSRKRFECIKLDIHQSKPYINSVLTQNSLSDSVRLLIDTGASHAILLDINQTKINAPTKTVFTRLGTGLGGEIPGQLGRMDSFKMNSLEFRDLIVSIPQPDAYSQLIKRGSRQGTVGGELLSRLYPIFDYSNEKLYLAKGEQYKQKFEFDMSGLSLGIHGLFLDTLTIEYIMEDSPAANAGIKVNDIILVVNGHTLQNSSLSNIYTILRKKPNYKIRLKILRGDEKLRKEFRLKRTI